MLNLNLTQSIFLRTDKDNNKQDERMAQDVQAMHSACRRFKVHPSEKIAGSADNICY